MKARLSLIFILLSTSMAFAGLSDPDVFVSSEYWLLDYSLSQSNLNYKPLAMAIEMRKKLTDRNLNVGFMVCSAKESDFITNFLQLDVLYPLLAVGAAYVEVGPVYQTFLDTKTSPALSLNIQALGLKLSSCLLLGEIAHLYAKLFHGAYGWSSPEIGSPSSSGYDLGLGLYFEDIGDAQFALGYRSSTYLSHALRREVSGLYIQANILIQ